MKRDLDAHAESQMRRDQIQPTLDKIGLAIFVVVVVVIVSTLEIIYGVFPQ